MQHQYKQQQVQLSNKPSIKKDNKLYRVQNPVRSELSLNILFLLKSLIKNSVEKTEKAHPRAHIIYDKVGGSWWKPEFRIIVGGKTKKEVEDATATLQHHLNRGQKKKKA